MSDLTRTLSTMKISRVDSPVVCLLLLAWRCFLAAGLTLQHSYPSPGNFNLVRLSCEEQFGTPVAGATFHLSRGGTEEEEEIEGEAVPGSPGVVLVTLSQQTEGDLRCRHGSETSQPLALAAQPKEWFECARNGENDNDIEYQLIPYSATDRYSFNCTIRPGARRESYSLEWRSRGSSFITHTNWDPVTFALQLTSGDLPPLYREMRWLECRVDVDHAPGERNTYCGKAIRAAVKATIVEPVRPNTVVQPNHPANLSCTATGSELQFTWYYGNRFFSTSDKCRNGICVHLLSSSDDPLRKTSVLSLSGVDTVPGNPTDVRCVVSQNLVPRFQATEVASRGTVTVIDVGGNSVTESETDPSNSSPTSETTPTTAPPTSVVQPRHVTILIVSVTTVALFLIVVPAAVITVAIVLCCRNRRRKIERGNALVYERLPNGGGGENLYEEVELRCTDPLGEPPPSPPTSSTATDDVDSHNSSISSQIVKQHFPHSLRACLPSNSRTFNQFMTLFLQSSVTRPSISFLSSRLAQRALSQLRAVLLPEREVTARIWGKDDAMATKNVYVSECFVVDMETGSKVKVCSARSLPGNRMLEAPPTNEESEHLADEDMSVVVVATDPQELSGDMIRVSPDTGSHGETLDITTATPYHEEEDGTAEDGVAEKEDGTAEDGVAEEEDGTAEDGTAEEEDCTAEDGTAEEGESSP